MQGRVSVVTNIHASTKIRSERRRVRPQGNEKGAANLLISVLSALSYLPKCFLAIVRRLAIIV